MMVNLISRQTIIDGLEFVIKHGIETDGAHSISAEAMLEFVRELPTVQPEITHEQAIDYLHSTGWMQEHDRQMMLDGVRRLTAHPEPHWIPTSERLPEINEDILLSYFDEVTIGWLNGDGSWSIYDGWQCVSADEISAWLPLPKVFKENERESN